MLLEPRGRRPVELGEARAGASQLLIGGLVDQRSPSRRNKPARLLDQPRMLAYPAHTLLGELQIDPVYGKTTEPLHVAVETRPVQEPCAEPVLGEVARVVRLSPPNPRTGYGRQHS